MSFSFRERNYLLGTSMKSSYARRRMELWSWGIVSAAVLALVGLGFAALQVQTSRDEFWIAGGLFIAAALIAAARIIYWGMTTTRGHALRTLVCICVLGSIMWLAIESIRYVNRRHSRWVESNQAPKETEVKPTDSTTPPLKASPSSDEPKPKLSSGIVKLPPQSSEILVNHRRYGVWAISFRNTSDIPLRDIVAQIDYENPATNRRIHVNYGYWIEEHGKRASLGVGDTERIALVGQDGFNFVLFDNKRTDIRGPLCELVEIPEGEWEARIELVSETIKQVFDPIRFRASKQGTGAGREQARLELLSSKDEAVSSEKAERIKQLSDFVEEGRVLLSRGTGTKTEWPKANDWAARAEAYIRENIGEDSAAWFCLKTTKAWPGLAVDRHYVDWIHTRIQRLGELAEEVRKG